METNFFSKLSLYDQLGYFLVGSIGLMVIGLDYYLISGSNLPEISTSNILMYAIGAYFIGHLIQAISNLLIKEDKSTFSDSDKRMLDDVRGYFGKADLSDRDTYALAYFQGCGNDPSGQVQAFNANYSLYRGWTSIFIIESVFCVAVLLFLQYSSTVLVMLILSIMLSFLFYKRRRRFYMYCREKTLQNFIINTKNRKICQQK